MSGVKKRPRRKPKPIPVQLRDNPGAIAGHLNDALSMGDLAPVLVAIGGAVRAQGVTRISRRCGLEPTGLHRSFRGKVNPSFKTVMTVLAALEIRFVAKPLKERNKKK
jgi:probable addiction module antidote protein